MYLYVCLSVCLYLSSLFNEFFFMIECSYQNYCSIFKHEIKSELILQECIQVQHKYAITLVSKNVNKTPVAVAVAESN